MGEIIDKMKGKVKQGEGELTGDDSRKAEGRFDEMKGKVKEKIEDVKHAIRHSDDDKKI
jgi:uncharacterized protein YjbJ (UPF0337 family)